MPRRRQNDLVPAFQAAPSVYAKRAYLQTLVRGAVDARKYVLATTNTQDVLQYNLEDKISSGILGNVPVPARAK